MIRRQWNRFKTWFAGPEGWFIADDPNPTCCQTAPWHFQHDHKEEGDWAGASWSVHIPDDADDADDEALFEEYKAKDHPT